jgi:hypothetical protein
MCSTRLGRKNVKKEHYEHIRCFGSLNKAAPKRLNNGFGTQSVESTLLIILENGSKSLANLLI